MRTHVILLAAFAALGACSPKNATAPSALRLLTYSSLAAPGGLGDSVKSAYERRCRENAAPSDCELKIVSEDGESSLVATYLRNPSSYDALLGLESLQVAQLAEKTELAETRLFARSPHAFVVDTHAWKDAAERPTSWKQLSRLKNVALVQDPRVSAVGIGWLKAVFVHRLLELADAKALTRKVFPSWSLSYAAFQAGEAPLVWSYQSSEAYHRCEEGGERYRVLPLEEGYPVQREYALVPARALSARTRLLLDVLSSDEIQTRIPLKNWMWPADAATPVPDCFARVTPVKALEENDAKAAAASLREWTDRWSL